MKKIILLFLIGFFGISTSVFSQRELGKTIDALINILSGKNLKTLNLGSQTVSVNSATKFGGKTRDIVKFTLPEGTKYVSVRITVLPITSSFQYEANETFYSLIISKNGKEVYSPQNHGIDFFLLNRSYDADGFLEKNNFNTIWSTTNTNSFIQSLELNPGNYWIGIRNPNSFDGLNVIVEIVACGFYN